MKFINLSITKSALMHSTYSCGGENDYALWIDMHAPNKSAN